ncbi:metal ABC transporter ATP-binding protein [Deinococcus radiophilus]
MKASNTQPFMELDRLSVTYGETPAVWDVSLQIPGGSLTAIVGPNGAGKSTLLKASLGLIPRVGGQVRYFGQPLARVRQRVGYVPQRSEVDWDFPAHALDVVEMGLYGQLGWFRRPGARERARALECLSRVNMQDFAGRQISQLSGGSSSGSFWPVLWRRRPT